MPAAHRMVPREILGICGFFRGRKGGMRSCSQGQILSSEPCPVVFVDGYFWHRHTRCKFSYTPKSRTEFWLPKFQRNVARDRLVTRTLRSRGWLVVRIWECQLSRKGQARVLRRVKAALSRSERG